MKILTRLFKKAAFLPFPECDLNPLRKIRVTYNNTTFTRYVKGFDGNEDNPPPQGPHFKHRRFWIFLKRKGWTWGDKKHKMTQFSKLSEDEQNCVAKFSQRATLKASTQVACYFCPQAGSVLIDLDEWEAHLKSKASRVDYTYREGYEPVTEPIERTNEALNNLFK